MPPGCRLKNNTATPWSVKRRTSSSSMVAHAIRPSRGYPTSPWSTGLTDASSSTASRIMCWPARARASPNV
ncbi:hypothetical protein G6F22_022017 [Rhizopus arrhizus]|nr:hypothetical protein G6F22_022017 [Rhizopus arrhizus]